MSAFAHLRTFGSTRRSRIADARTSRIIIFEGAAMNQHPLPVGLRLFIALACGGGAAFMLWRTIVALRSGSIWLRGQNVTRLGQPTWFWSYLATYLIMLGVMLYGMGQAFGA